MSPLLGAPPPTYFYIGDISGHYERIATKLSDVDKDDEPRRLRVVGNRRGNFGKECLIAKNTKSNTQIKQLIELIDA